MLDKALIREHPDLVRRSLRRRGLSDAAVDEFLALDERWRKAVTTVDRLKAERNRISGEFAKAKSSGDEALRVLSRTIERRLAARSKPASMRPLHWIEKQAICWRGLPNILADDVPDGADASANVELRRFGEPPKFSFDPKPHWEIGERLGIFDFERGVRLARSRFVVLAGAGARLNRALINFFLERDVASRLFGDHAAHSRQS